MYKDNQFSGLQNSARRVLEGIKVIKDVVVSVSSPPGKVVGDWVTDRIAPAYWKPNHEITHCHKCRIQISENNAKHHCRKCGEGFCDKCSSRSQPVPSRGWHSNVRVCDDCYNPDATESLSPAGDEADVMVRKYSEVVVDAFQAVASVLEIPKGIIKESARPAYWMPDNECLNCAVCQRPFGLLLGLHHCRDCGKGVCDECSNNEKAVPVRGWNDPVRVCNYCQK